MCELVCQIVQKKQEEKQIEEEQAASARYWKIPACCDDDDDHNSATTPVLSTKEPVDSLSIPDTMCDVHLVNNPTPLEAKDHFEIVIKSKDDISSSDDDSLYNENIEYVEASPHDSEVVSLEVAEIVIPEDEEIKDDNLHKKMLNVRFLIANIEALKDNPTPSSKFLTKSSSTSSKSFLEETYTFHKFLPEFKNFCLDLEEISSGSTTTHSNISLSEYDSFIFDLSNDQCPPIDRSDFTHEEFTDDLTHIISLSEYDCFYFRNLPDPGKLMSILNSKIRENLSTTSVNLPVEDDHSPLLTYVVWIFLAYLTYPVISPYLHSFGNKDTIFDPGIIINRFYSFKPVLSHRCGIFKKFNTHRSHLNESPMEILLPKDLSSKSSFPQLHFGNHNEIRLSQRLLYDNSSPRPPEEFNSKNSYADIESFSPSPIPNENNDSFMEEIDLFLTPDDPMPPSIEDDDDSEGDILFLERLLHDDPIPLSDTLDFSYEVRIFLPFFTYP
nr:hypothetical protein [Tanacetum cinerariifolium]